MAGNEIELNETVAETTLKGLVDKIEPESPVIPDLGPGAIATPKEEPEKVDYSEKTVVELREIAEEKDIDVKGLRKAEIIEALE